MGCSNSREFEIEDATLNPKMLEEDALARIHADMTMWTKLKCRLQLRPDWEEWLFPVVDWQNNKMFHYCSNMGGTLPLSRMVRKRGSHDLATECPCPRGRSPLRASRRGGRQNRPCRRKVRSSPGGRRRGRRDRQARVDGRPRSFRVFLRRVQTQRGGRKRLCFAQREQLGRRDFAARSRGISSSGGAASRAPRPRRNPTTRAGYSWARKSAKARRSPSRPAAKQ